MRPTPTIFDIETAGLSQDILEMTMPEFKAPAGWKDPAKIQAAIEEKRKDYFEEAALNAISGQVLAIGMWSGGVTEILCGPENEILDRFWDRYVLSTQSFIGFNIAEFDVPFLVQRSFRHGINVPQVFDGRYLVRRFVDLMKIWACGKFGERISLDRLGKFLGTGEKSGSGADFAKLWETDKPAAIAYLNNDIELILACAKRMGVMQVTLTEELP